MDRKLLSNYRASANHRPIFLRTAPTPTVTPEHTALRTSLYCAVAFVAAFTLIIVLVLNT